MEWIDVIVNNGVAIGCLCYFMWYNNNTMVKVTEELANVNHNVMLLIEKLETKKPE